MVSFFMINPLDLHSAGVLMYMIKIWFTTVASCPFPNSGTLASPRVWSAHSGISISLVIAQWDKLGFKAHVPRSFVKCHVAD